MFIGLILFSAIVGGLILLVNMGPGALRIVSLSASVFNVPDTLGGLSVDEKKKNF